MDTLIAPALPSPRKLTKRERQVAALLAYGLSTRKISVLLFLSINTIDRVRQSCYAKLDIHDRVKLARWAIMTGVDVSTPVTWKKD